MEICPICRARDQVQKVSAIVAHGSHTTQTHGRTSGWAFTGRYFIPMRARHSFSGFSRNHLASALSFPDHVPIPWLYAVLGFFVLNFGDAGGFLGAIAGLFCGAMLGSWLLGRRGRGGCIAMGTGVLLTLWMAVFVRGVDLSDMADWLSGVAFVVGWATLVVTVAQRIWLLIRRPARARAWHAWNRLYYCFRDDTVYDPATGRYGPPGATRSLAWK
ncbi:hypothetical protein [Marinactinospora rubrisoli]|uniref:Uncharacterized protein n=1 Tax=Marinactinospora rubrisoli TaxID=2715399 RepID=A0ABW2KBN5_9ACTN